MSPGRVYLVGAGPGDPALITVRGREVLQRADAVLYDHLAEPVLRAWAPATAERVYVGKVRGHRALEQGEIDRQLAARARAGQTVVRLKGGDPFVFGRGAEEALALARAGVPCEVVPGVSASVAVPELAGIPVTHRGLARSFAVITGHERPAGPIVQPADTVVVLMGTAHLAEIAAALIAGGRAPDTPAAVVSHGSLPSQRTVVADLGRIAAAARDLPPPAVLVVGAVVGLRRPAPRVLVARERDAQAVRAAAAEPVLVPVLRVGPPEDQAAVDAAAAGLESFAWVCFTSANGVRFFLDRLFALGGDARRLGRARLAAVGRATAEALRGYGLAADVTPERATAADLAAALGPRLRPGARVLFVRGREASPDLPAGLGAAGARVEQVVAYRTEEEPAAPGLARAALSAGLDAVTLASAATARQLAQAAPELRGVPAVCIGPRTAAAARELGFRVAAVAAEATAEALAAAVRGVVGGAGAGADGGMRDGVSDGSAAAPAGERGPAAAGAGDEA